MKKIPMAAVSVISALALGASTAWAQDTTQPTTPDTDIPQTTEQPGALGGDPAITGDTASTGESLESWDEQRLMDLSGEDLMNSQGDSLGEIQEFVRSTEDDQIYAVISSDEALAIDDMTAVAVSELRWENDQVVYSGEEQELERMFSEQPYEEARYEPLDESAEQQLGGLEESEDSDIAATSPGV